MRNIFEVFVVLVLARLGDCLIGGREMHLAEYPFLVVVERDNNLPCAGIILDHLQVVVPNSCVRNPNYSIGYLTVKVVPVVNVDPPKKYKGWLPISDDPIMPAFMGEVEIAVVRLEYPGMKLGSLIDRDVNFPTHAPFGPRTAKLDGLSDVTIAGIDGRVVTMTILPEDECRGLKESFQRAYSWMISAKQMLKDNLICAAARSDDDYSDKSYEDQEPIDYIPVGQACERDVGAPVMQNGVVVGLVVRAFCSSVYILHVTHVLRLHFSDIPKEKLPPDDL